MIRTELIELQDALSDPKPSLTEWERRMRNIHFILCSKVVEESFGVGAMFEFQALRHEFLRLKDLEEANAAAKGRAEVTPQTADE